MTLEREAQVRGWIDAEVLRENDSPVAKLAVELFDEIATLREQKEAWRLKAEAAERSLAASDLEWARRTSELRQRAEAAEASLEVDRTAVADCLTAANRAIDSRHWLTEGRGSYEWDDDRWHGEFQQAAIEIKKAIRPLTKIAANWKNCPQTSEEVRKARLDLAAALKRYGRHLEECPANISEPQETCTCGLDAALEPQAAAAPEAGR